MTKKEKVILLDKVKTEAELAGYYSQMVRDGLEKKHMNKEEVENYYRRRLQSLFDIKELAKELQPKENWDEVEKQGFQKGENAVKWLAKQGGHFV